MPRFLLGTTAAASALTALLSGACESRPLVAPFDFSRSVIGLGITVRGAPLYVMLDTGVSPSAIDTTRAKALGLKIDFAGGGEASGDGDAAHVMVYPTWIDGLVIGGRRFGRIEALAVDMGTISRAYGRPVDATLGHSFLAGKLVLIDYPARTVGIYDRRRELAPLLARCRTVWRTPLRSYPGDTIPIVELGVGGARLPVSLDTGSSGSVELYRKALDEPAVKSALTQFGTTAETGARGGYTAKVYRLNAPITLGPFTLPAGETVTLGGAEGSRATRLANVGNKLLASLRLRLLLDYRNHQIAFIGACQNPAR